MGYTLTADKAKVIRHDKTSSNGTPYTTYSLMVSSKDSKTDEWANGFLEALFPKGTDIANKTLIKITNAFPMVSTYKDKAYIKWYVKEYDVLQGEGTTGTSQPDSDGFCNVPEGVDEDLPFARPERR